MEQQKEPGKAAAWRRESASHAGDRTPAEVYEESRGLSARLTAGATGAAEGYADYAEPGVAADALRKVSQSIREASRGFKEETRGVFPPEWKRAGGEPDVDSGQSRSTLNRTLAAARSSGRDAWQRVRSEIDSRSPEEVRDMARTRVGRVAARVRGYIEGFVDQADPAVAGRLARKAGAGVREVVSTVRSEFGRAGGSAGSPLRTPYRTSFGPQGRSQGSQSSQETAPGSPWADPRAGDDPWAGATTRGGTSSNPVEGIDEPFGAGINRRHEGGFGADRGAGPRFDPLRSQAGIAAGGSVAHAGDVAPGSTKRRTMPWGDEEDG